MGIVFIENDFWLVISGIFIGILISIFIMHLYSKRVYKSPTIAGTNVSFVRIDKDGEHASYVNTGSFGQSIENLIMLPYWFVNKKRNIRVSNKIRVKFILSVFICLAIITLSYTFHQVFIDLSS